MKTLTTLTFILWLLLLSYHPAQAVFCPNQPQVDVLSSDSNTIHMVCNGSDKALTILATYGLAPKRPIVIEIVQQGLGNHGYLAYGTYDTRSDRIQLMSFEAILENNLQPRMYEEEFDLVHYYGAIAHEITHAVFHHHSTALAPGIGPQEYLAHAIQLLSMPQDRRDAILAKLDVSPWISGDAISDIYMALEPGRFAVKSYKHLTSTNDPHGFIQILLNAKWF